MGLIINPYVFGIARTLGSIIGGGTNIGDYTQNGGLASCFDGATNVASATGAQKSSATSAFIGKTLTKRLFKVIFYGSNNNGYVSGANPSITIEVRAQAGGSAPANAAAAATAGSLLGTITFTDTANESASPREIICTDQETLFDHWWGYVTQGGSSATMNMTEMIPYEAV